MKRLGFAIQTEKSQVKPVYHKPADLLPPYSVNQEGRYLLQGEIKTAFRKKSRRYSTNIMSEKKVVIISSSPRKGGNSEYLCQRFADGAREAGNKVEIISLTGKKIGFCTGCYACQKTGTCVQKDDVQKIIDQMLSADIIVLSTPVYFYTVSAQLKALIDRTVVIYPNLTDKQFYYIMTMADGNDKKFKATVEALRGFLECYDGSKEVGMIRACGVYEKGEVQKTDFGDQAYQMGKGIK